MGEAGVEILKDTGYMDEYEKYMQSIRDRMDIPVELEIPAYEVKYFADDSHLNKEGQMVFTKEFRQNNNL